MPKTSPDRDLCRKVRRLHRLDAEVKALYEEIDQLRDNLLLELTPGVPVQISRKSKVVLVDKFAGKSKLWKSTPFNRYEVEIVPL